MSINIIPPTIIFPGSWNPAILQPQWIVKEAFEKKELTVSMEFTSVPTEPPKFTIEGILFIPAANKLVIRPQSCETQDLAKAEEIAIKILGKLQHTPTKCFGINFEYTEINPNDELLEVFSLDKDLDGKISSELEQISIKIVRSLKLEDNILNLSRSLQNDEVIFNFNFHYETSSASESSERLKDRLSNDLEFVKNMLASYDIQLDNLEEAVNEQLH